MRGFWALQARQRASSTVVRQLGKRTANDRQHVKQATQVPPSSPKTLVTSNEHSSLSSSSTPNTSRSSSLSSSVVRLNRLMAAAGLCSRREADDYLRRGWVRVNGQLHSNNNNGEPNSSSFSPFIWTGGPIHSLTLTAPAQRDQSQRATILLHKPLGVYSTSPQDDKDDDAENNNYSSRPEQQTRRRPTTPSPKAIAVHLLTNDREYSKRRSPHNNDGHASSSSGRRRRRQDPRERSGWAVAGRLDVNSSGLLVLTQAGLIAQQLIGGGGGERSPGADSSFVSSPFCNHILATPRPLVQKEYLVSFRPLTTSEMQKKTTRNERHHRDSKKRGSVASANTGNAQKVRQHHRADEEDYLDVLRRGVWDRGDWLEAVSVDRVHADQLRVVLTAGKHHHIRRMCQAAGLHVVKLKRVRIGRVVLGDLPVGQWRYLLPHESFVADDSTSTI